MVLQIIEFGKDEGDGRIPAIDTDKMFDELTYNGMKNMMMPLQRKGYDFGIRRKIHFG